MTRIVLKYFLILGLSWSCKDQKITLDDEYQVEIEEKHLHSKLDAPILIKFVDVATSVGVNFKHTSGKSGRKYGVETIGSGAVFFDYNNDGWIDLYAVNGSSLPGYAGISDVGNAMFLTSPAFFRKLD